MEKIITKREYKQWLENCSEKHIVEEDIKLFNIQINNIKELIKIAKDKLEEANNDRT